MRATSLDASRAEGAIHAADTLRKMLRPGDTLYTILRGNVSRSGMYRRISVLHAGAENEIAEIDWLVGRVTGRAVQREGGVACRGTGMDMGFDLIYSLSRRLWPDGYECIGEDCPANDHSNGDRNYEPHHHSEGGYALRHRWI